MCPNLLFPLAGVATRIRAHALRNEFEMQRHAQQRIRNRMRAGLSGIFAGWQRLSKFDAASVVHGEDLGEDFIQALNERRRSAKVGCEMHGIEAQRRFVGDIEPDVFDARKEFGVGATKEIDGLHRIANHEAGAAFGLGPRGNQAAEQLVLAAAGVLEFVNEQMADAVGNGHGGFRWLVIFAAEHAEGNLRDLDEVDHACLSKSDAQISGGPAKHREAGAHDLPFLFRIAALGCIRRGTCERHFQTLSQLIPVLAARQNKGMHPAVALAEHVHQQLLHLLPVVVAPLQERFSSRAHRRTGIADFLERTASGATVKLGRLLCNLQAATKT